MGRIKLGDIVRCIYSGFEGTATARTEYQTGCVHFGVTASAVGTDGKPIICWFDEQELELVEVYEPTPEPCEPLADDDTPTKPPGGPMPTPPSRHGR